MDRQLTANRGKSDSSEKVSGSTEDEDRMQKWAERKAAKKQKQQQQQQLLLQQRQQASQSEQASTPKMVNFASLASVNSSHNSKCSSGSWASGGRTEEDETVEMLKRKDFPVDWMELIGSGSFAKVYRAVWTKSGSDSDSNTVAVKVINMDKSTLKFNTDGEVKLPKCVLREIKLTNISQHDNIIRVVDVFVDSRPYVIVLEYCAGGSLDEHIVGEPRIVLDRFGWHHRCKAALDIACGMRHLHSQSIVHRDLKTQNVLLANAVCRPEDIVVAKVCDFGMARYLPGEESQTVLTRQVGSWYCMAPELFGHMGVQDVDYDEKVDVYSYGMMVYQILAGDFFFPDDCKTCARFVIFASEGGRPREDAIPHDAPADLVLIMKEAWQQEPNLRPSFADIIPKLQTGSEENSKEDGKADSRQSSIFGSWFCCAGRK